MSLLSKAKREIATEEKAKANERHKTEIARKNAELEKKKDRDDWFKRIKKLVTEGNITVEKEKSPSICSNVLAILKRNGVCQGYFVEVSEWSSMRYSDDTPEVEERTDYICLAKTSNYNPRCNYGRSNYPYYIDRVEGYPYFAVTKSYDKTKDQIIEEIGQKMVQFYKNQKWV